MDKISKCGTEFLKKTLDEYLKEHLLKLGIGKDC